jgi:signal transduction histidine kinase
VTLRGRLILTITLLLASTCVLFSAVALLTLDRSLRNDADRHLATVAQAVAQIVDNHHGTISVDAGDQRQIATLHGPEVRISVVDRYGHTVFGTVIPPRQERRGLRFSSTTQLHDDGAGRVTVWESDAWIGRIDRMLMLAFLAASGIVLSAGFFLARLLADRILKPVQRMAILAESIEARDLSSRIDAPGNDELGRLCASFDRMLERLENSFATERRFVADASHELRTPLAIVRAETDLALRRPRTEFEYRDAFVSVDAEVTRLEALIDDLLDTMRDRSTVRREPVDIAQVVERVTGRLRPAVRELRVDLSNDVPVVLGHAESIERATTAVLHNALTHGGAGAVDVCVRHGMTSVQIDVTDDGPGFAGDALHHATERFWRADSARSRGGTGLGLSIARVLMEAHGGELRLANGPERGAVVSLVLPANNWE